MECSLKTPTIFDNTVGFFIKKNIIQYTYMGMDVDLCQPVRDWLNKYARPNNWWWDHFREEFEISIYILDPKVAMLFKLTWL